MQMKDKSRPVAVIIVDLVIALLSGGRGGVRNGFAALDNPILVFKF